MPHAAKSRDAVTVVAPAVAGASPKDPIAVDIPTSFAFVAWPVEANGKAERRLPWRRRAMFPEGDVARIIISRNLHK